MAKYTQQFTTEYLPELWQVPGVIEITGKYIVTDKKSLLVLAHGSYWVNVISIDQNEPLIMRACYARIHVLPCRTDVNYFAFFIRIEASVGQAWSQREELLFALLPCA